MLRRLAPKTTVDWAEALALRARLGADAKVTEAVGKLVADVRARGDAAVRDAARRFDGVDFTRVSMRVAGAEWEALAAKCPREVVEALAFAAGRIEAFHRAHAPASTRLENAGAVVEQRIVPLEAVLCYAPGGRASYPSTVLMTAVPARVAGVGRVCVTSPAKATADISPAIAAAAKIAGADELWRLGGVQAMAAFALGTQTIARVDKLVGPGNSYVTEAKRQLSSEVGIDSLAGPTEVLIVAEEGVADPRWIAADLVAQAEHDPEARAVLVTTSALLADEVDGALRSEALGEVARAALTSHGCAIVAGTLDEALQFAHDYAPEHLELVVRDPRACLERVTTAGAVFLGAHSPVPVGDYLAGPNHTLPTAGTARFSSGLSTADFVRRQSVISYEPERLRADARILRLIADVEGLPAHARAVEARLK